MILDVDFSSVNSFSDLLQWAKQLPNQTVGIQSAVCETGEPYVEVYHYAYARPDDAEFIESVVAKQMHGAMKAYLEERSGRIYWRIPLETIREPMRVIIRYDENGPDVDHVTDRKCVMDGNWVAVKAYCRLYRAPCLAPIGELAPIAEAAWREMFDAGVFSSFPGFPSKAIA